MDTTKGNIKTHDYKTFPSILIKNPDEIVNFVKLNFNSESMTYSLDDIQLKKMICIAVDEIQFFDSDKMIEVTKELLQKL